MFKLNYMSGVNPSNLSASAIIHQRVGYASGIALQRHVLAVHKGVFDPKCPACIELKAKTPASKSGA